MITVIIVCSTEGKKDRVIHVVHIVIGPTDVLDCPSTYTLQLNMVFSRFMLPYFSRLKYGDIYIMYNCPFHEHQIML